jgi:hypothetical protein
MKHVLTVYCCVTFVFQKNAHVVTIDDYEDVPENDEEALKKAVANQPVSIAIEAGGRDFQLYSGVSSRDLFCWSVKTSFSLCFELRSGFVCFLAFVGFYLIGFLSVCLTLGWGGTVGSGCIHWRLWH